MVEERAGIFAKYRYIYKISLFLAALFITVSAAFVFSRAVPALEVAREVAQPSGEQLKVTLHGDEWFNYTSAENGDLVVKGSDGYWYYGVAAKAGLEQSSAKYKINAKPANAQTTKDVAALKRSKYAAFEKTYGTTVPNRSSGFPESLNTTLNSAGAGTMAVTGTQKVLVLLVSFNDVSIVNTDSAWSNLFFGDTGKTLKNYYKENSQNSFYFTTAAETKGTTNDGVVRVALTYAHPDTGEDINSKNQKIVVDALKAANAYINYSLFDTNNNGIVTAAELHIITVVAGNDCSSGDSSPCIWPHSWSTDDYIYLDGKNIYGDYTQIAEKQDGHMTTMGVVAHELGHDIGLPDLYDTDYSSDGLGVYSLMAAGSWGKANGEYEGASPTHMDAWCKIQLGFVTPLTTTAGSYSMNSAAYGGYNTIKITTTDPNQYFLVENRQATGFDAGLYYYGITTGGIAIYHVDMSVTTDNDNETRKLVDLEEANEVAYGGRQLDDDNAKGLAYNNLFRAGTNTLLSNATTPNSKLYNGTASNIAIGVPGVYSGTMTVNINFSTITYQSNGGTAVSAASQPAGTVVQKPADPAKTGYTFNGWYSNTGLTAPVAWPYTTGLTDVIFYAKWTPNTYTIIYNGNGSTGGSTANSTHAYDVAGNLTVNGFTKIGFTFLGWSMNSSAFQSDFWDAQSVLNLTPNTGEVITFYAVWAVNHYNITFDANGGAGGTAPVSMEYGEELLPPAVIREGYTFNGWSPAVPDTVPPAETVYIAQWMINQYTISFNSAGGSAVESITQNYGTGVSAPADPVREGYTFDGWIPAIPAAMPAEETGCVAQWTINIYEVAFDLNGASGTVPLTQTGSAGTVILLPAQGDIQQEFYAFMGWALSPDAKDPLESCLIENTGFTLYAVWARIPVSLAARPESTAVIDAAGGWIYGLAPGMTESLFESAFITFTGDGRLAYSGIEQNLGTGRVVTLFDNVTGEAAAVYTIVIFGDVNGDGSIDSLDAGSIVDHENYITSWDITADAALYKAGDLNGDGTVDSIDAGLAVDAENYRIAINQVGGLAE